MPKFNILGKFNIFGLNPNSVGNEFATTLDKIAYSEVMENSIIQSTDTAQIVGFPARTPLNAWLGLGTQPCYEALDDI